MNTIAITKSTIIQELSRIPDNRLNNVKNYLDTLLTDLYTSPPKNQSLKGIWKDAGFENMFDLEGKLHQIRQELQHMILQRER